MQEEMLRPWHRGVYIVPFGDEHVEEAAQLFAAAFGAARKREPLLPPRHTDPKTILPRLRSLARGQPGAAAVCDGRLAGYLLAKLLPDWRGERSAWAPEWAHAAVGDNRWQTYRLMYAAISERWVADGRHTHLVTLLADDHEAVDAFFWSEFGMMAVDAVRDVACTGGVESSAEIRRAVPKDTDTLVTLIQALRCHLSAAPVFLQMEDADARESIEKHITDPKVAFWLAFDGGEPAGYMKAELGNPAVYVLDDSDTAVIKGAFTRESSRGSGVGTALLNRALEWARENGCTRCAVDFEPQNVPGRSFWMRHFKPVCYSLVRRVDLRRAEPSGEREVEP